MFDLDETLIHCNDDLNEKYDKKFTLNFDNGEILEVLKII
ncbi:MAG: hypothetical protein ACK52J_02515 [bacterium]